jgi:hypothetical protein
MSDRGAVEPKKLRPAALQAPPAALSADSRPCPRPSAERMAFQARLAAGEERVPWPALPRVHQDRHRHLRRPLRIPAVGGEPEHPVAVVGAARKPQVRPLSDPFSSGWACAHSVIAIPAFGQ